jgi:hypothetical protein
MSHLRQIGIVILIVLPVAILVLIRGTTSERFKQDARKLAEPSFSHSNAMSREQLATFTSGYMIIDISDQGNQLEKHPGNSVIHLPAGLILEKAGQDVLRSNKLPVLLYSPDPAISARVWMLLSQMGYHNLYILVDEPDNEVIKYKFRPDSTQAGIVL